MEKQIFYSGDSGLEGSGGPENNQPDTKKPEENQKPNDDTKSPSSTENQTPSYTEREIQLMEKAKQEERQKFENDRKKMEESQSLKIRQEIKRENLLDKINNDEFMKAKFKTYNLDIEKMNNASIESNLKIFNDFREQNTSAPAGQPVNTEGKDELSFDKQVEIIKNSL